MNTDITTTTSWSPHSWLNFPVKQLPPYPDHLALERSTQELASFPPLVTSWEVDKLKKQYAAAARGEAFVLQGGDCAESFDKVTAPQIVNLLKVLLQMSLVLIHEMNIPVVRVGRMAGQYAKPRSNETEEINGEQVPVYRGDLFNGFEPNRQARIADPKRLVEGYHKSALTLNFIRALTEGGGFADLHHPEYWELDFMKQNTYYKEYEQLVSSITNSIRFVESISPNKIITLKYVQIFTSHEALNLYYESAQTRQVPHKKGWYNLSAHSLWLGNRTRDLDGAHVEYLRGIENPIGIKVGNPFDLDEIVALVRTLNPTNEEGKITLITRFGNKNVGKQLPNLIETVRAAGLNVLWSCDPMHGNTFSTNDSIKTRDFNDIIEEITQTFKIHKSLGSRLGGVHLELTGGNVTECVGGAVGLNADSLKRQYESYCDPRLNYEQSLEMAFLIARLWKNGSGA